MLLVLTNCGFKVLDKSKINNFTINSIITNGDNRINYKIRNDLLINSLKDSTNLVNINLNTNKKKTIKEKNIKNEITKYQMILSFDIELDFIKDNFKENISFNLDGDYSVGENYSTTLNNEKKLLDDLVQSASDKVLEEIGEIIDDF